jgi:hypothetical protein
LPLYLAFADPMNTPGLILAPYMAKGFKFVIMDVNHTAGDRIIELNAPEELYDIAALIRDPERFVVESIWSRQTGDQAVSVSRIRIHNITDRYTGKDNPVMLVRGHIVTRLSVTSRTRGFKSLNCFGFGIRRELTREINNIQNTWLVKFPLPTTIATAGDSLKNPVLWKQALDKFRTQILEECKGITK